MKFLAGLIAGLIVVPLIAFLCLRFGLVPVATSAPPLPFERTAAKMALNARISREAPSNDGVQPTEANFMAGVMTYRANCAVCHGLPGQPATAISKGMFPKPPQLFVGHGVTDDPAGETYWKVKNGIRLTGMPAFQGPLSDQQIWQVSELLAKADKLPPSVMDELKQASGGAATPSSQSQK